MGAGNKGRDVGPWRRGEKYRERGLLSTNITICLWYPTLKRWEQCGGRETQGWDVGPWRRGGDTGGGYSQLTYTHWDKYPLEQLPPRPLATATRTTILG